MRTLRTVPLAISIALLLALAGAASAGSAGRPVLSTGDFWDTSADFAMEGGAMTMETHTEIMGFEDLAYNDGTVEAVKTVTTTQQTTDFSGSGFSFTSTTDTVSTVWSRASDGAMLKMTSTTKTSSMMGQPPQEFQSETVYKQPCKTYEWPIAVGDEWSFTCEFTSTTNGKSLDGSHTSEWRVVREEKVTVPAGTFDAFVLENGTETKVTQWYAPAACTAVKSELESSDPDMQAAAAQHRFELESFKCAKAGETAPATDDSDDTPPSNPSTPPTSDGSTSAPPKIEVKDEEKAKTPAPAALAVVLAGLGAALLARRRA